VSIKTKKQNKKNQTYFEAKKMIYILIVGPNLVQSNCFVVVAAAYGIIIVVVVTVAATV